MRGTKEAQEFFDEGMEYLENNRLGMAIRRMRQTLDEDPKFSEARAELGRALFLKGEVMAALKELAQGIKRKEARAWFYRALIYWWEAKSEADTRKALRNFTKANELAPNDPHFRLWSAKFHLARDYYSEAIKDLKIARKGSDQEEATELLIEAYTWRGMTKPPTSARPDFDNAMKLAPEDPKIPEGIGDAYRAVAQFDEAFSFFFKAFKLAEKAGDKDAVERLRGKLAQINHDGGKANDTDYRSRELRNPWLDG